MAELDIGAPAPAFELEGPAGPIRLADFAGQTLVLYFYPKDDTSGCTKEAIDFSEQIDAFAAAGATVLGVSKDSVASHGKFAAKPIGRFDRRQGWNTVGKYDDIGRRLTAKTDRLSEEKG